VTYFLRSFPGERNVYLHALLEKPNGVDIRARNIPKETIAKAEAEGKQVRPTRDTQYVESYWALLIDGSFKTYEQYNYGKAPPQAPGVCSWPVGIGILKRLQSVLWSET
jgi:hypothetical protein